MNIHPLKNPIFFSINVITEYNSPYLRPYKYARTMKTLKTFRENLGFSQRELADKVGLHNLTILNIENRNFEPTPESRSKIEYYARERINWLSTMGLKETPKKTWEDVEKGFRDALLQAYGLSKPERDQFLQIAREYITTFADMVEDQEIEDLPFPVPPDVLEAQRRRRINRL